MSRLNSFNAVIESQTRPVCTFQRPGIKMAINRQFGTSGQGLSWAGISAKPQIAKDDIVRVLNKKGFSVSQISEGPGISSEFRDHLNILEDNGRERIADTLSGMKRIYSMALSVTTLCNGGCPGCLAYLDDGQPLGLKEMMRLIDIINRHDVKRLSFTGGEPLLYAHISELIGYAHELGLTTALTTNGTLLSPEVIAGLQGILDEIVIPYPSSISENAVKLAPYATQEHLDKMEKLFKMLIAETSIGLIVETILSRANMEDMVSTGERLLDVGAPFWRIDQYYEVERNRGVHKDLFIGDDEFEVVRSNVEAAFLNKPLNILWQPALPRSQNEVFFVARSGKAVQTKGHRDVVVGDTLSDHARLFSRCDSNTPVANYTANARKEDYSRPDYMRRHYHEYYSDMVAGLRKQGRNQPYRPHTDYGANILLPEYARSAIAEHLALFAGILPEDEFYYLDPLLYSSGLGALGEHPKDILFDGIRALWETAPQTKMTAKGPFMGDSCVYYLLCPSKADYFEGLRSGLSGLGIKFPKHKQTSYGMGWVNVCRVRKAISMESFDAKRDALSENGLAPVVSFATKELGAIKSDWLTTLRDGELIINRNPVLS